MKTIILTIILFLFSFTSYYAQWEILNEGFRRDINTIDFVNENVGWIAGSNGTLEKTTDGGENWNDIYLDPNMNISQIDFINEDIGWAVGYTGPYVIWKTTNGGNNWVQQYSSAELGFNSLYAIDESNVFAVGDKIYKTTNGGTDWIDISPNLPGRIYNSVWFQDSQTGVVVGNYNDGTTEKGIILKTTNGGSNWNVTTVNQFNNIYDLQFLDFNNGYFRAHKDTANYICKTEDMCASWNVIMQSHYSIISYQYLDNNTAYAIMDDSVSLNNVKKSQDGGYTWQTIQTMKFSSSSKLYINEQDYGFIFGWIWGGHILYKRINTVEWIVDRFSNRITDVVFWDENNGLLSGCFCDHRDCYGYIFSTVNGGITPNFIFAHSEYINYCFIPNENVAVVSGGNVIYKTNDFGYNWNVVYSNNFDSLGYSFGGNDISVMNEQIGFAVGGYQDSTDSGAGILITTTGGDNWYLSWKFSNTINDNYWLHSIHLNENIGWSVGESGMILKYTPQTGWVQQTSVTDLPLNKVFFSDENHGWIVGGYQNNNGFQKILLKTTDDGLSWNNVPNIPHLFRDIAFVDNNLGWAIGYDSSGVGGILKTTDGGLSWSIETGNLPAQLNSLHIKDNYGWAVGDNGLILRTTDAGAVWVEDENNNSLPTEFVLEQNYPNPFNPSTTISWQSPVGSRQIIKIYDVLGRDVETLVDEFREAGLHSKLYIINSTLPSGVYFYQLKAGSYTSTQKMLLLK